MQSVIELGRVIRERKARPLKQPLRSLTVVHPDRGVLADLEGELAEYIYQEVNVREMTMCSDPEEFGTLRAEPVFAVGLAETPPPLLQIPPPPPAHAPSFACSPSAICCLLLWIIVGQTSAAILHCLRRCLVTECNFLPFIVMYTPSAVSALQGSDTRLV